MKKLIVFSVVFALLAVGAFAEASIGGSVGFGMQIIHGSNLGDADPDTTLKSHGGGINFTWDADDGSAGGKVKLTSDFNKGFYQENEIITGKKDEGGIGGFPVKWGGRVWWKPLDILRIEFFNLEDEGVMGRGGQCG
jgi:hypothetical protein